MSLSVFISFRYGKIVGFSCFLIVLMTIFISVFNGCLNICCFFFCIKSNAIISKFALILRSLLPLVNNILTIFVSFGLLNSTRTYALFKARKKKRFFLIYCYYIFLLLLLLFKRINKKNWKNIAASIFCVFVFVCLVWHD